MDHTGFISLYLWRVGGWGVWYRVGTPPDGNSCVNGQFWQINVGSCTPGLRGTKMVDRHLPS